MSNNDKIKITISGPAKSGKTNLIGYIAKVIRENGGRSWISPKNISELEMCRIGDIVSGKSIPLNGIEVNIEEVSPAIADATHL